MRSRVRQRALGGIVLTVTFLAGAAAGALGLRVWSRMHDRETLRVNDMSAVLDELRLDPTQRRMADSIVEQSAPRTRALMIELAGRMTNVADSVDAQLRTLLTPAQRTRLDALRRKPIFLLKRRSDLGTAVVDTVHPAAPAAKP